VFEVTEKTQLSNPTAWHKKSRVENINLRVELELLERLCRRIITTMSQAGITYVDLDRDYYWNIPTEEVYDPYNDPNQLDIGQLSDDWAELLAILNEEREPLPYALVWLATIMRAVGESTAICEKK
jgi:hypothetical protein